MAFRMALAAFLRCCAGMIHTYIVERFKGHGSSTSLTSKKLGFSVPLKVRTNRKTYTQLFRTMKEESRKLELIRHLDGG